MEGFPKWQFATIALRNTDRVAQHLRNAIQIATRYHLTACDYVASVLRNFDGVNHFLKMRQKAITYI